MDPHLRNTVVNLRALQANGILLARRAAGCASWGAQGVRIDYECRARPNGKGNDCLALSTQPKAEEAVLSSPQAISANFLKFCPLQSTSSDEWHCQACASGYVGCKHSQL